ncbi:MULTISPECIES: SspB-related isopeptide-forming adhesin [Streptococcus]|uniref:Cell surface antigen I/II n=2 Tax=Streptococcus TaxID=1301 RepID=A0A428CFI1_STRMT|nr:MULTISPECIES: SspB-related isopeptide-forming adhesin [Streptococcus]ORO81963.1 peptidase [Streptococcus oralis subsp. dentisani]RSI76773.1 Cell surface antigen I/II precursor [Streptococcus mitis]RSJ65733.1 Cell surface antigen I/II precursor [Streptococcus oralis]
MFKTQETKQFGSIRKFKKYGACGVILGMAALAMAFSSGSVSADELSANQNVPKTVQEAPKQEAPKQDEIAKKNTTVDVVVDHSTVDKAVSEAKKAGLEVKQDSPVDVGVAQGQDDLAKKQASVEKDYANQANTVSTEIAGYKKDVADNETEKKHVQDENEKIRQAHEKAKKDLQEKNDQIDKRNDDAQKKYNQEYEKYLGKEKEFKQAKSDLEKLGLAGSATGVKMYGEYNEAGRGSMNYYKNFKVAFDGVSGLETVKDYLGYHADTKITSSRAGLLEDYSWRDTEGKFVNKPKVGDSFTIHNIGETQSGKKISAKFTFKSVTPEWKKDGVESVYHRMLVSHEKNSVTGAINFNVFNMQAVDTDIEYFEEGTGKKIKLAMVSAFSDIDFGQELRWEYEDGTTGIVKNPSGSDVVEANRDGKTVYKGEHRWDVPMGYDDPSGLNRWKASDHYYKNVSDEADVPVGSILSAGYGERMHLFYSTGNKSLATRSQAEWDAVRKASDERRKAEGKDPMSDEELFMPDFAFQLWGRNASISKPIIPPVPPIKPTLEKHEKDTIPDPEYLSEPGKVKTRTVHVRYANLRYKPSVNPTKSVEDIHGNDINEATTFDKNVKFKLKTDYAPYSKFTASPKSIAKRFAIVDDVQDGAYMVDDAKIKATDDEGKDVKQLFNMYHVLSDKGRTDVVNEILKESGFSPKGEFYMWIPKDNTNYYKNYVSKGKNVTFDLFAKLLVKEGQKVQNDFHQIDFGIDHKSNLVTVEVPDIKPEKHAVDQKDNKKVLDGQEVQIGQYIRYLLDGVTVPTKHDSLFQYDGSDQLDVVHDRFTGKWSGIFKGTEYTAEKDLVLPYDVVLKDGKVVKAGNHLAKGTTYAFLFEVNQDTDPNFLKKIVTVKWNEKEGKWSYVINQDFLNSLGVKGTFDADFYLEVERISAGKVENTFINTVNLQEMTAKVTTTTPEPPKPEPKEPHKPQPQASLPNTGTASSSSMFGFVGIGILSMLGLVGLKSKKEVE